MPLVPPQSFYLRAEDAAWDRVWPTVAHEQLLAIAGARPEFIDGTLRTTHSDTVFDSGRDPEKRGYRHLNERGYAWLALLVARRLVHDGRLDALAGRRGR